MATHNPIPLPVFSANDCKRFWAKVRVGNPTECWPWIAGTSQSYGKIRMRTVSLYSHRVAYYLHYGIDTHGQFVLHHCDNPPCCNPSHLFLGSQADNIEDMILKGRRRPDNCRKNPATGERNAHAKLNHSQVLSIRRLSEQGESQTQIAIQFGISRRAVGMIIHRERWKHLQ